jgi:hemolysin III
MSDKGAGMAADIRGRRDSRGEIVADGIVHAVGLAAATAGAGALIAVAVLRGASVVPAMIYVLALIAMLAASAAYNLGLGFRFREALRRLDHAGIFIMIAGTYTPFTAGVLTGGWAIGLTAAVWAIAALGVLMKTAVAPHGLQGLTTLLYLAFGWVGAVAAQPFLTTLSPLVLWLVLAGGIIYTLGTIFFTLQRLPYRRAIWHGFVVAGAAIHFCAIFVLLAARA